MKGEILLQNVFYLFIIAIILEASVMAIFSISAVKKFSNKTSIETVRDLLIMAFSFIICYKEKIFTLFHESGIKLPFLLDIIISSLVLARMTFFIREFLAKLKHE